MSTRSDSPANEKSHHGTEHNEIGEKGSLDTPNNFGVEVDHPWTPIRMIAIFSLCMVYVGSQIILYFTSSALTPIALSIKTTTPNWMLTANTLGVAAICPWVGHFTDLCGRRVVALLGSVLLIVSSIIQATSYSLGQAVTAQAIGGIGAGMCELVALAGVAEITPTRWRGVTLSLVTFSIVPFMPQLLYTVLIVRSSTWRYCFLLTGLWNFVGLVGLFFCYRPPPRKLIEGQTAWSVIKGIDWLGTFLSIGGITLFLVGLQAGGYQYPWTSGHALGPLIVGGLMTFVAFPASQYFTSHPHPLVPARIFQGQRVVALAYVIVFVAGMEFYSILGFFPLVLQYVYVTDAITVGVRGLCYPWAILGGACLISFLMSYTRGHVRQMFFIVAAMMTVFTALLSRSTPDNPGFTIAMATLAAFGNGALVVPALTLAFYAAPDDLVGTVGALSLSVRFLGGSVGTSIYFNVFLNRFKKFLPTYVVGAAVAGGATVETAIALAQAYGSQVPGAAAAVPGVTNALVAATQYASQKAYSESLRYVWYTTIPFGVISCVCCAFLPNIRKYMTNKIAVDIH
ncbi:MFS drug efflux pump like protein [Zymoseptoria brevis]|uniref:MFS drug efflux pump like protein n=1 Tax=Zymoseptoria brevis TaxID=1047168 RepID=A0A0F4GIE6_9PEZI|nr:MFS drug efflux pump like protein [Zymoseptoria brevis]